MEMIENFSKDLGLGDELVVLGGGGIEFEAPGCFAGFGGIGRVGLRCLRPRARVKLLWG